MQIILGEEYLQFDLDAVGARSEKKDDTLRLTIILGGKKCRDSPPPNPRGTKG